MVAAKLHFCLNLKLTYKTQVIETGSCLLILMLEKLNFQLVSFDLTNNPGAFVKTVAEPVFEKIHLLKCWNNYSLLNCIGTITLSLLLKLPPIKLEP